MQRITAQRHREREDELEHERPAGDVWIEREQHWVQDEEDARSCSCTNAALRRGKRRASACVTPRAMRYSTRKAARRRAPADRARTAACRSASATSGGSGCTRSPVSRGHHELRARWRACRWAPCVGVTGELREPGRGRDGHREQEREARGGCPRQAAEQPRRHRHAGTRGAGHERERLRATDHDDVEPTDRTLVTLLRADVDPRRTAARHSRSSCRRRRAASVASSRCRRARASPTKPAGIVPNEHGPGEPALADFAPLCDGTDPIARHRRQRACGSTRRSPSTCRCGRPGRTRALGRASS